MHYIVYRIDVLKDVWWSGIAPYLDAHVSQINFWTWYWIDAQRCIKHWYRSFIQPKKKTKLESSSTYIIESVKMILEFGEAFGEALKTAKKKNNKV